MSDWDRDTPGAGDVDGLQALVHRLVQHLDSLPSTASEIDAVTQRTQRTRTVWTGEAAQAWENATLDRAARLRERDEAIRRGAEILHSYQETVLLIDQRARHAQDDLTAARTALATAERTWRAAQHDPDADDHARRAALLAVQHREEEVQSHRLVLERLVDERQSADDCVTATLHGGIPTTWSGGGLLTSTLPDGTFRRGTPGTAAWVRDLPDDAAGDAAARWLVEQLTAEEFDALLAACPGLAIRLMRPDRTGAFRERYPALAAALTLDDPFARIDAVVAATASMTPEQLGLLSRLYPGIVHNLDGMPLTTRIDANRVAVLAAREETGERIAAMQARIDELLTTTNTLDDVKVLSQHLKDLTELTTAYAWYHGLLTDRVRTMDADGNPTEVVGHQVVLFEPTTGQFAELVGYAGAPNIGVLVGGTGTRRDTMDDQRTRAWTFVEEGRQHLAVLTYLGGPMPQSLILPNAHAERGFDAVNPGYAAAIGPRLASFVNGVRAVTGATITVAGHSYGGSVVGAAEARGMVADRVLHIESAGAGPGIGSVQDYAAPDTPRYSMTAPGDPIEQFQGVHVGSLAGHGVDPDLLDGVTRLETGRVDRDDPASGILQGGSSHSDVFKRHTDAWWNIYAVMAGGDVALWTDPTIFPTSGPHYTYPMQDPEFVPPTGHVP